MRSRSGHYSVTTHNLEGYLVPRQRTELTADMVRRTGRGIAYTKSPFGYLFRRLA